MTNRYLLDKLVEYQAMEELPLWVLKASIDQIQQQEGTLEGNSF